MEEAVWLTKRRVVWLLAGLVVAGALLRFLGLSVQSLWWDELFSWWLSDKESLSEVLSHAAGDVHPPAHPVIIYFVERYLGDSEFWLRLPSALFGVFSIPAMYLLAKRMFSKTEGVWAAALTTVLWFPIYYSQEARGYALLFLLCVLSMAFWIQLFRAQTTREPAPPFSTSDWILYVLCAIGMVYTHHYGSIMVALQGLALLSACGTRLRAYLRTALLYLPIVACSVPVWLQAFGQYRLNYLSFRVGEKRGHHHHRRAVDPASHSLLEGKESFSVCLSIAPGSVDPGLLAVLALLRGCRGNASAQAHADHPLSDCIRPGSLSSRGPRHFGGFKAAEDPDCGRVVVAVAHSGEPVCRKAVLLATRQGSMAGCNCPCHS